MFIMMIFFFCYVHCRFKIVSTGGTASSLESVGVSVTKVEQITCFPEMVRQHFSYVSIEVT